MSACARLAVLLCAGLVLASGARAQEAPFAAATLRERPRAQVPLAAPLRDAEGRVRTLGEALGQRPALLVLGYYHCTMLCGLLLEGTSRSLARLERAGTDVPAYAVVSVSIDPRDDAASAAERQHAVLARLGWPRERWPFLTGAEADVRAIADAVGFGYHYDPATDQFAHAAAVAVLAPDGRVSSYLYGVEPPGDEIAAALREAQLGGVRSPLQRMLLRCFHYVPALRRHGAAVAWFLRLGAVSTLAVLGVWLALLTSRTRGRAR